MSRPDDDSPRVWLRLAERDLQAAEVLLSVAGQQTTVCFHAQQAAEKALKASLVALGAEDVPRTHDLHLLAELVVGAGGPQPPLAHLTELADCGVAPRYPGSRDLTPADGARGLDAARAVVAFARQTIGEQAPS